MFNHLIPIYTLQGRNYFDRQRNCVEDQSHLEIVTNEEISMLEEATAKEEEEAGSEKQVESEDEEMSDPPASPPPVSDSSSISIPPSPIPKEVIFKSAPICIRLCKLGESVGPLHNTVMHPLYGNELYYAGSSA